MKSTLLGLLLLPGLAFANVPIAQFTVNFGDGAKPTKNLDIMGYRMGQKPELKLNTAEEKSNTMLWIGLIALGVAIVIVAQDDDKVEDRPPLTPLP